VKRLVRRLAAESPGLLALGIATAAVQATLLVPIALIVRQLFDTDLPQRDSSAVVWHGLMILGLYCATAVLGYLSRVAVLGATTRAAARIRSELIEKVHELSQDWHDGQRAGLVHAMIVQDSQRVEEALRDLANPLLPAVLVTAVLAVVAIVISPLLALALLLFLPLSTLTAHILVRRARARTREWLTGTREFGSHVQLALRAMTATRVQGAEATEVRRAAELADGLALKAREMETARAAHAAVQAGVGAIAGSLILIVGGVAVAEGSLTLGDLLAFYAVLAILIRQLHAIGTGMGTTMVAAESLERLETLLATPSEDPYGEGREQLDFRGGIELRGVTFAYSDAPVLEDIDLVLRPSEHVALLGPNGAGKSTLVALVAGLYRPQSGLLLADGVPFDDVDIRHFRRRIGVVLQDPVLVPGTIRENVAYGRPDASEAEIRAAVVSATAAGFVDRLPDGLDTLLGDEGAGLSGGQRQRLAIARALLGEPALLLLDEPTTYLDEAGVTELMANLASLPRAPTVVLVTHDPHAASHAERTVELRDGRIAFATNPLEMA
jgi:ATP-binding cassette, subfamily B, bacterial